MLYTLCRNKLSSVPPYLQRNDGLFRRPWVILVAKFELCNIKGQESSVSLAELAEKSSALFGFVNVATYGSLPFSLQELEQKRNHTEYLGSM